jgi:hypothetical protein
VTSFGALLAAVRGLPTNIDNASVYTGNEPSTYESAYVKQEQLAYAPTYSKAVDYYVSWHANVGHCTVLNLAYKCDCVGPVAQSVYRLATGWTVRGSNPGGGRDFQEPVQTGPGAHPASCKMGIGSFPGVESGRGVTLTPHPLLVPRSENRVELYIYSP